MPFDSEFLLRIPAILFCLTIHEFAHGWMARRLGDPTAELQGRLTLNPLAHLDPFGTIMILFGPFGWAKPVPVDAYNLNHPRKDMIKVAFAGPGINLIAGAIIGLCMRVMVQLPFFPMAQQLYDFLLITLQINVGLAFFNLLPIPPLDGSNVLMGVLPPDKVLGYQKAMARVPMIFLGLLAVQWLGGPPLISIILYPLYGPFKDLFQFIVFQRVIF